MVFFGATKKEGPYRYVFVEPGELREGVVDLISHCWSIWGGKEDPVTPLERVIRLARKECHLLYYSMTSVEAFKPIYVIQADAELIRLVYPFVDSWGSFISVLKEVVGVTRLK